MKKNANLKRMISALLLIVMLISGIIPTYASDNFTGNGGGGNGTNGSGGTWSESYQGYRISIK